MKRVLVVEDEAIIREFIVINLKRAGYEVVEATNGKEALEIINGDKTGFAVVLTDVMMPEMDGLELCKEIRTADRNTGVIMLSAKTQEMDKISGLLNGADDYITKPFSPAELIARVDSLQRRVEVLAKNAEAQPESAEISMGKFKLNLRRRMFYKDGELVELTHTEYQIIEHLFNNPGVTINRNDILEKVWGGAYVGDDKIVDVNIRRLRVKIEADPSSPEHLTTVWGIGYKWKA